MHRLPLLLLVLGLYPALSCLAGDGPAIRNVLQIRYGPSLQDDFRRPEGITANARTGLFTIADTGKDRLLFFDVDGRFRGAVPCGRRQIAVGSYEPEVVSDPKGVCFDERGRMLIVDRASPSIEVRTALGYHIAWLIPDHLRDFEGLTRPEAAAVGPSGRIYVLYAGEIHELVIMDAAGGLVRSIDLDAEDARRFLGPVSFSLDSAEESVAIVDPRADPAVWVYDLRGQSKFGFGKRGEGEGTFSIPTHVLYGPGDTIWVTDAVRHSISVFDREGTYLGRIGGFGDGPGQFRYPSACAFVGPNQLAVLERGGQRYQILEIDLSEEISGARTTVDDVTDDVTMAHAIRTDERRN